MFTKGLSTLRVNTVTPGPYFSDHCAIELSVSVPKSKIERKNVKFRKTAEIDPASFVSDLDLTGLESEEDLNILLVRYSRELRRVLDIHAPEIERKITIRHKNRWFKPELCDQKRKVQQRECVWRKYHQQHQWEVLKRERKVYRSMLASIRTEVLSDKVKECNNNSGKLYDLVKELTNTKAKNPLPEASSEEELANQFVDYFMNKIKNIREALDKYPEYSPSNIAKGQLNTFTEVTQDQVIYYMKKMPTKGCKLDPIPTKLFKQFAPNNLPLITRIVNLLLKEGVFADNWKVAIIRPLLKKVGMELITQLYCPVSNLSFLSKLVEVAALDQFNAHCEEYDLMSDYQSAYHKILAVKLQWLKSLMTSCGTWKNKKPQPSQYVIYHQLLTQFLTKFFLEVLYNKFGVTGKALEWFRLYLEGRKCKVNVGTSYSRDHDLNFSVPQGICVGPVAYSAYASTIQEAVNSSEFAANTELSAYSEPNLNHIDLHGYADDHGIKRFFIPKPLQEKQTITLLEEALLRIKTWMDLNHLKMNTAKTEFIVFGSKQQLKKVEVASINVNGDSIPRSEVIKYLGTWMDQHLNFRQHILKKCNVAMINLQRIKAIRKILTVEATETLVRGLVTSHLDYSNAILHGLPEVDIQKLQRVQNYAAEIILKKNKYDSSIGALKELHWLPINLRINHKILSLTHNCIHGKAPKYLQDLLTFYKGGR